MEQNLRVLAQLSGEEYRAMRDSMLQSGGDFGAMAQKMDDDRDWRIPVTARILDGWQNKRESLAPIREEVSEINPATTGRRITGMVGVYERFTTKAAHSYGPDVLPLAWEMTLKFHAVSPATETASYLAMMIGAPDPHSVAVAGHLIETSTDETVRERAAHTLAKLSRQYRDAVIAEMGRLEARAVALDEAVTSMNAFVR